MSAVENNGVDLASTAANASSTTTRTNAAHNAPVPPTRSTQHPRSHVTTHAATQYHTKTSQQAALQCGCISAAATIIMAVAVTTKARITATNLSDTIIVTSGGVDGVVIVDGENGSSFVVIIDAVELKVVAAAAVARTVAARMSIFDGSVAVRQESSIVVVVVVVVVVAKQRLAVCTSSAAATTTAAAWRQRWRRWHTEQHTGFCSVATRSCANSAPALLPLSLIVVQTAAQSSSSFHKQMQSSAVGHDLHFQNWKVRK
mmetsp:Transcript_39948/g.97983  ORF Transcript_39948/g.97983 Transcript_39948/m.97983 type:complete len:259 (-) Transcript_39948:646-1422(-)